MFMVVPSLVALTAGEIVVRTFCPIKGVIYQADAELLHKHRPGSRKMYRHPAGDGGKWVLVNINKEGRRGGSAMGAGTPKVLVYGDSFIAAEYSELSATFCARLESLLNLHRKQPLQVLNCGVSAYGPDQSLLQMESDLKTIHPALVVFAIYTGNDFGDLARNKLFRIGNEGSIERNAPELSPSLLEQFGTAESLPRLHIVRAFQSIMDRLNARQAPQASNQSQDAGKPAGLMEHWLQLRMDEHAARAETGNNTVSNLFEDGYDADVALAPESPSALHRRALMDGVLGRIKAAADKHGVPVLLLIIPSPFDVVDHYSPEAGITAYPEHQPERLCGFVASLAEKHSLGFLNLFASFHRHDAAGLYFKPGNDHWNDAGQALAAEVCARTIDELGFVD